MLTDAFTVVEGGESGMALTKNKNIFNILNIEKYLYNMHSLEGGHHR